MILTEKCKILRSDYRCIDLFSELSVFQAANIEGNVISKIDLLNTSISELKLENTNLKKEMEEIKMVNHIKQVT